MTTAGGFFVVATARQYPLPHTVTNILDASGLSAFNEDGRATGWANRRHFNGDGRLELRTNFSDDHIHPYRTTQPNLRRRYLFRLGPSHPIPGWGAMFMDSTMMAGRFAVVNGTLP